MTSKLIKVDEIKQVFGLERRYRMYTRIIIVSFALMILDLFTVVFGGFLFKGVIVDTLWEAVFFMVLQFGSIPLLVSGIYGIVKAYKTHLELTAAKTELQQGDRDRELKEAN